MKYKNIPIKNIIDSNSQCCFLLGWIIYYLSKNKILTYILIQKIRK